MHLQIHNSNYECLVAHGDIVKYIKRPRKFGRTKMTMKTPQTSYFSANLFLCGCSTVNAMIGGHTVFLIGQRIFKKIEQKSPSEVCLESNSGLQYNLNIAPLCFGNLNIAPLRFDNMNLKPGLFCFKGSWIRVILNTFAGLHQV